MAYKFSYINSHFKNQSLHEEIPSSPSWFVEKATTLSDLAEAQFYHNMSAPNHSLTNVTSLMDLPPELRLQIMEYLIISEGVPEIRYHRTLRSKIIKHHHHPLTLTCKTLSNEFHKIQREKATHVIHHVFDCGGPNGTHEKYPDAIFGDPNQIRQVKVVAEFSALYPGGIRTDKQQHSNIDILTSECQRFPKAHDISVELRMSASTLPFYGVHPPNEMATELILVLGIQSCLPSKFLPGPTQIEGWLASIIAQFSKVRSIHVVWEGLQWEVGSWVKEREEKLLRDCVRGISREGTEIVAAVKQLW
jgi:hypothetical protein